MRHPLTPEAAPSRPRSAPFGVAALLAGALWLGGPFPARAGDAAAPAVAADGASDAASAAAAAAPLQSEWLRTGLYLIRGDSGNALLRFTSNGLILVDSQPAALYRPLMSQVRRIGKLADMPVRLLVLTNASSAHAGSVPQFRAAGVPVLAQRATLARLPAAPAPSASGKAPAPLVGFDDRYPFALGGVALQVLHLGPAATDGDALVLFPDLRVAAIGDLYAPDGPLPDGAAGGSLVGWAAVLRQVLTLDIDLVVPGRGPPLDRAALAEQLQALDPLLARARTLLRQGTPEEQLLAELRAGGDSAWLRSLAASPGMRGAGLRRFCEELLAQP